ncbi:MAG: hypothetical protein SAJ11_23040 [Jaaginema sp. PMC 1078.18]|nr:hypothetical protein [Jaaginema sp. PMC 1078.18]
MSNLDILESENDLELLFTQQTQPLLKDKVGALYLLKLGKVKNCLELARVIGWDTTTLETWLHIYQTQGLSALLQSQDEIALS